MNLGGADERERGRWWTGVLGDWKVDGDAPLAAPLPSLLTPIATKWQNT